MIQHLHTNILTYKIYNYLYQSKCGMWNDILHIKIYNIIAYPLWIARLILKQTKRKDSDWCSNILI